MKKGLLVILSGPSGVGKGTIRKELMKNYPELELNYSISVTTRAPRDYEVEGVDYFFVDYNEFEKDIKEDKFLEYSKFVGNLYGTPRDYVENLLNNGKNVLLEIEVNGAKQVFKNYKGDNLVSIFLIASIEQIKNRITSRRTEDPKIINARLTKAKSEFHSSETYDYVVENDDLDKTTAKIAEIIKNKLLILN